MLSVPQVDTEACEQIFSWLSRYGKMTRKMNRHTYMFFIIYLCDLHNERITKAAASEVLMLTGFVYTYILAINVIHNCLFNCATRFLRISLGILRWEGQ